LTKKPNKPLTVFCNFIVVKAKRIRKDSEKVVKNRLGKETGLGKEDHINIFKDSLRRNFSRPNNHYGLCL